MPEEFSRTTARKKIILPGGDTIYVPVITKISFIDPFHQYQEYQYLIENGEDADRTVHTDNVHPVPVDADGVPTEETPAADISQELFVERIETFKVVDPFSQYQESQPTIDNTTGNDLLPPHFSNHAKTHIYRYHQDPQNPDDDGVWVDSELVDRFEFVDPFEQYQERQLILANPTNAEFRNGDLSGQASSDDPDITIGDGEGEGTEANPIRLDPFQNIVNYSGGIELEISFFWTDYNISSQFNGSDVPWRWTIPANLVITLTNPDETRLHLISDDTIPGPYAFGNSGSNPTRQPAGWTAVNASNQFTRRIIYKIPTLAKGETLTFPGSMTPMADYTSEVFIPVGPTSFQATGTINNGPWPQVNIRIIRRKPTPEDPENVETLWAANTYESSIMSGQGSGVGPPSIWYRTGIFKTGGFELKLGNVADPEDTGEDNKLACWISKSAMRTIPNVEYLGELIEYKLGIYQAFADWLNTGGSAYFPFGKSPIDANLYSAGAGEGPIL